MNKITVNNKDSVQWAEEFQACYGGDGVELATKREILQQTTDNVTSVGQGILPRVPIDLQQAKNTCTFSPLRLLWLASLFCLAQGQRSNSFPEQFDLSKLDGSNGFVLDGVYAGDSTGYSVSNAGDVNGDGMDDLIIGAPFATPQGRWRAGKTYVVFGGKGLGRGGLFKLASLNGSNGFVINGEIVSDNSGFSVTNAGDLNGDGMNDLLIGAPRANFMQNAYDIGKSYVLFGRKGIGRKGAFDLLNLNGKDGFIIVGEAGGDYSGTSVSAAGDFNGDGKDDLIIGAVGAAPSKKMSAGRSYVVYGDQSLGSSGLLELYSLKGLNGLVLNGEQENDHFGCSVSYAGDFNGDGIDDLIIGAFWGSPPGRVEAGKTYVIFGRNRLEIHGALDLSELIGIDSVVFNGMQTNENSGRSASYAGDVNGDGIADLLIGAPNYNFSGKKNIGRTYVLFGRKSLGNPGVFELSRIDGSNGFMVIGEDAEDHSGWSVSSVGDFNGDGIDDLLIGANFASPSNRHRAGKAYLVFGSKEIGKEGRLDLLSLNGTNGFTINGIKAEDYTGQSVSAAGDVNGDGIADIIIGANQDLSFSFSGIKLIPSESTKNTGKAYVIFGRKNTEKSFRSVTINNEFTPLTKVSSPPPITHQFQMQLTTKSIIDITNTQTSDAFLNFNDPITFYLSIAAAVTSLACSLFTGVLCYIKRRSTKNSRTSEYSMSHEGQNGNEQQPNLKPSQRTYTQNDYGLLPLKNNYTNTLPTNQNNIQININNRIYDSANSPLE